MDILKIATLNINGLTSPTRTAMLEAFLMRQDIDILLIQEDTQPVLNNLSGFRTHYNIGTCRRGTAIVVRDGILLENVTMLPSGRAIAVTVHNMCIINIYAPSGTAKKQERERF
jgi:exonuclease III